MKKALLVIAIGVVLLLPACMGVIHGAAEFDIRRHGCEP